MNRKKRLGGLVVERSVLVSKVGVSIAGWVRSKTEKLTPVATIRAELVSPASV